MGKLKWHIVLVLALWLVFCGMAAAEQLYVNEGGWWRDGGVFNASTAPIQAAIDAATPGDSIFVYNGTYYEGGGVSITKERITLQGEDANTTIIHGKWTADTVVHVTGDYVNVSDFTVAGSALYGSGIYVNADYCTISDNDASEMEHGIRLGSSSNNTLTNNTASNNYNGIYMMDSSSNCVLTNNTASSNYYGIRLGSSTNCVLMNNTANSNNEYGIFLQSSSNNTLENNIASSNRHGIRLHSSSDNNLTNNTVSNNDYGIRLASTSINNNIKENTISGNTNYGTYLDYSSDNEIYHNNFIENNKQAYDHNGFNSWGKGASVGGNYWSDHACRGNPSDGTEPYIGIDTNAGAVDTYPFEELDGWVIKNQPPIANFTYIPLNPIVNQTVTFNASDSADSDGTITNYKWEFGDGTNGTGETVTQSYVWSGNYIVNLTVTDDDGATGSTSKTITVAPPPFTTADATIALQIAVGSRPLDLRWDLSDDGQVTSLDALMILQAVAGGIEIG